VKKSLPAWAFGVLSVVGVILAASMLLNWIDLGGEFSVRGLSLAWDGNHWLFLVPIAGVALVAAASKRSEFTRLAALFAGVVVAGDVVLDVTTSVVHSGLDTWMILGGATAMIAGASAQRTTWRAVGGIAVLVGFFAPWADFSMFRVLTSDFGGDLGFVRLLWLVPVGGVLGLISAGNKTNGKLAAGAGVLVFGALLGTVATVAYSVFGLGAWAALGASAVALVIAIGAGTAAPAAIVSSSRTPSAK
jgi:hypothetical protein